MDTKRYTPTIGLEIHAELKTHTKMFCNSKNDPDEKRANVNICPICMAHPGTLPVINKKAVESVIRVGVALGGDIADYTEFDRKNYFYPDIPKGYQISQYEFPLVKNGSLLGIDIERIHLEEDTASSTHEKGSYSLINFNRAGVPLMELVTKPVIHTAEDAMNFAKELQLVLRYLGVADAQMEKGEMRVEANISVSDSNELGTKTEVKNINSFTIVGKAIEYEIKRQIEILESGGKVLQETRGWDDVKGETYSQRKKESSHDYRYFPDPDLPKIRISQIPEFAKDVIKKSIPELPQEKRNRYKMFIKDEKIIEFFITQRDFANFLDQVLLENADLEFAKLAVNYISSDLSGLISKEVGSMPSSKDFTELIHMIISGDLSSRGAKDTLLEMVKTGENPRMLAEKLGVIQKSNEEELLIIVRDIIRQHTNIAKEYLAGKQELIQFFIGQGMKATKGAANPAMLKKLFEKELSASSI